MPKRVDCPIKRWPGVVTFKDPIPLADCVILEHSIKTMRDLGEDITQVEAEALLLPGVLACIERFELGNGFTLDPFPGTPRRSSAQLVAWLIDQVMLVYRDEAESVDPLA